MWHIKIAFESVSYFGWDLSCFSNLDGRIRVESLTLTSKGEQSKQVRDVRRFLFRKCR